MTKIKIHETSLKHEKNLWGFFHECCQTLEQVAQRGFGVSTLGYIPMLLDTPLSKLSWLTCFEQEVGQGNLHQYFPTPTVLCFFN